MQGWVSLALKRWQKKVSMSTLMDEILKKHTELLTRFVLLQLEMLSVLLPMFPRIKDVPRCLRFALHQTSC
ncbi:UNVERIFIED_CONTAM: hypothetical protein GTU68_048071 [Idotea baltica]|nr:hypothetical protein [Idotea baltica]